MWRKRTRKREKERKGQMTCLSSSKTKHFVGKMIRSNTPEEEANKDAEEHKRQSRILSIFGNVCESTWQHSIKCVCVCACVSVCAATLQYLLVLYYRVITAEFSRPLHISLSSITMHQTERREKRFNHLHTALTLTTAHRETHLPDQPYTLL